MSKPADIHSELSAYLDGELSETEVEKIRVRLLTDTTWRSRLEEFRELNHILALWDCLDSRNIRASAGFEARLLHRLRLHRMQKNLRGGLPPATRSLS